MQADQARGAQGDQRGISAALSPARFCVECHLPLAPGSGFAGPSAGSSGDPALNSRLRGNERSVAHARSFTHNSQIQLSNSQCHTAKRHRPYSLPRPRGGPSSVPCRRKGMERRAAQPAVQRLAALTCLCDRHVSPHGAPSAAFLSTGTVLPGADGRPFRPTVSRQLSPPFIHASSSH